jgi:hypothetical protein
VTLSVIVKETATWTTSPRQLPPTCCAFRPPTSALARSSCLSPLHLEWAMWLDNGAGMRLDLAFDPLPSRLPLLLLLVLCLGPVLLHRLVHSLRPYRPNLLAPRPHPPQCLPLTIIVIYFNTSNSDRNTNNSSSSSSSSSSNNRPSSVINPRRRQICKLTSVAS